MSSLLAVSFSPAWQEKQHLTLVLYLELLKDEDCLEMQSDSIS